MTCPHHIYAGIRALTSSTSGLCERKDVSTFSTSHPMCSTGDLRRRPYDIARTACSSVDRPSVLFEVVALPALSSRDVISTKASMEGFDRRICRSWELAASSSAACPDTIAKGTRKLRFATDVGLGVYRFQESLVAGRFQQAHSRSCTCVIWNTNRLQDKMGLSHGSH